MAMYARHIQNDGNALGIFPLQETESDLSLIDEDRHSPRLFTANYLDVAGPGLGQSR